MKLLSKNVKKKNCAKYDKLYIFEKPRRIQVCKNIFKIFKKKFYLRKTENFKAPIQKSMQNLFANSRK